MSLSASLQIANKSLMFSQTALNTVSHNIANVNNKGYTRQVIYAQSTSTNGQGDGVKLLAVERQVNAQLVKRMNEQTSIVGYTEARQTFMKDLEVLFGTPGAETSTEKIINKMFAEMNALANNPDSTAQRLNFVQSAEFVVDALNTIDGQLQDVARTVDTQISNELSSVNEALRRIYILNNDIAQIEANALNGQNASDLRDERQRNVDILAKNFKLSISEDQFGKLRIYTESGRRLIDDNYTVLERTPGLPWAGIGARAVQSNGSLSATVFPIDTDRLSEGVIKSLVDIRDTEIPDLNAQLDEFARVFAQEVNRAHSRGVGVPVPSSLTSSQLTTPGTDLFTEIGLTPGSSFRISAIDKTTGAALNSVNVTLPGVGPYSAANLVTTINTALTGAGFPGTVTASFSAGRLTIQDSSGIRGIALGNDAADFMGKIQINPFFEGNSADTLTIRSDILGDASLVATARMRSTDFGVSRNDNRNMVELAKVAETRFTYNAAGSLATQSDTFAGYYISISSNLSVKLQDNASRAEFANTVMTDITERNAAVSGVSMDEELSNLILYQNSFQASARLVTTVDELYQTIINMV
jgi:flagellar hook-associated protein 1 FlgK